MTTTPFPFLKLPLELRESIYSLYFKPADRLQHSHALEVQGFFGGVYNFEFGLCSVNRQVRIMSIPMRVTGSMRQCSGYTRSRLLDVDWIRQIYQEAKAVWRRENIFVKIATPWPSAGMYRVYLMATDSRDLPEYAAGGRSKSSVAFAHCICQLVLAFFAL